MFIQFENALPNSRVQPGAAEGEMEHCPVAQFPDTAHICLGSAALHAACPNAPTPRYIQDAPCRAA